MCVCVCVCTASYGLDEDQWQAVVNMVANTEVPYNAYNCIVSGGRISYLEMEAIMFSKVDTHLLDCMTSRPLRAQF